MDDAFSLITDGTSDRDRIPTTQKPSILQLFLVKENNIRRKYFNKFLSMGLTDTDEHFTESMCDRFKPTYVKLYNDTIRSMWKEHEIAFLSPHVAQRMAHRRQVQQTNNKKKDVLLCWAQYGSRKWPNLEHCQEAFVWILTCFGRLGMALSRRDMRRLSYTTRSRLVTPTQTLKLESVDSVLLSWKL